MAAVCRRAQGNCELRVTTEGSRKEELPEVCEYLSRPPLNHSVALEKGFQSQQRETKQLTHREWIHPTRQTRITISHPWIKALSGTNGFTLNQFKLFYTQSISFVVFYLEQVTRV